MLRRAAVSLLVCVLAAGEFPASAASVAVVGVVTQASLASVASARVSTGATVYDGDSLATAAGGLARVRARAAQFYLAGQSSVRMRSALAGTLVQLTAGTLVFSSANAAAMDVEVARAHIRPASNDLTVAQVSIAGAKSIDIRAKRGSLEFSYEGESKVIPEGVSYRIILDPLDREVTEAGPPTAFPDNQQPKPGAYDKRRRFIYLLIGVGSVATFFAVDEALESPDKP